MRPLLPRRAEGPPPPIRLAVDMSHLRPGGENGGIKPLVFETLLWLGRQQRAPLQFLFLTCARTHAEVRDQLSRLGDEVVCVSEDGGQLPYGDERFPRERLCVPAPLDLLTQLSADVLYCPFGPVTFATPGIGTISTIVDVLHRDFPGSLAARDNEQRERVFHRIVAVADALQCNSAHVIARMRECYGVAAERMFTVYNAVHGRFSALPPAAGGVAPLPADGARLLPPSPFFFYPANFWKHKNHERLLSAYGMYRAGAFASGIPPWPLVLTGHRDERCEEVRAFAQALGLLSEQAVQFVGYVPPDEFARWWEKAGALVFPSLHEGFGIPLLEAMAQGVPILCSRAGSLPEVGADACLFVDARHPEALADGMTRLANDGALRQRLVAAGRRRVLDFSLDREAGHLLDAIIRLSWTALPYRPLTCGISPDGWIGNLALMALPADRTGEPLPGRLTLQFQPLPVTRRLRLRVGASLELGSFVLPADQAIGEISARFRSAGGALRLEVLDAAPPGNTPAYGVHLRAAALRLANGQEHSLFPF